MVLLGGLMLETERFDTVVLKINHHDFKNERHQLIFESMGELVNENKPLDPITLSEDLDNKNKLQFIGGKEYLVSLVKVCLLLLHWIITQKSLNNDPLLGS